MGTAKSSTSNSLNRQFVFINKDKSSKSLTNSDGIEKQVIYGHVRRHMVKDPLGFEVDHINGESTITTSLPTRARRRKRAEKLTAASGSSHHGPTAIKIQESSYKVGSAILAKELDVTPYSRSYAYFKMMTVSEATGFADVQFWNSCLQLSSTSPAIFHALTSLGALHESLISADPISSEDAYRCSLMHCNRAIRATVDGDRPSLPLLLVGNIIFATLQIFVDAPTAQKTLQSALPLVELAYKDKHNLSESERALLDMTASMIQRYQSRLTLVLGPTTIISAPTASRFIERPPPKVPAGFDSLLQARRVLESISDWAWYQPMSPGSLERSNTTQRQWLKALKALSGTLHPLSTRSLNLLKIARLASACLIAAQHMARSTDFDQGFLFFRQILSLYRTSIALSSSKRIFFDIFDLDDDITDILTNIERSSPHEDARKQARQALAGDEAWNFFFGTRSYSPLARVRVRHLEFFPHSNSAKVSWTTSIRTDKNEPETISEGWFSLMDGSQDVELLQSAFASAEATDTSAPANSTVAA